MATTYDLGGEFELKIEPDKPFQFSLLVLDPGRYCRVAVERRYQSSDPDCGHPARRGVSVVEIDENKSDDKEIHSVTVKRPGLFYCEGMEYDTIKQKYWILVEENGEVKYLDKNHPIVKNGYALMEACKSGKLPEVKRLLEVEHVDPNSICDAWGALHQAAQKGHLEIVKLLAKYGADVDDVQNWIWVTPLQMVADKTQSIYNVQMVKLLVSLGADATNTNENLAKSIVHYAQKDKAVKKAIDEGLKARSQNK
eukprot:Phypoly_transcript_13481.p1 GENE.Phypoly_transcript_13481~~Phypoly_transcript_13481.p1  ORF type:complete len:253 (+),score=41.76 Phypoly_transcript_13481:235-993(+)